MDFEPTQNEWTERGLGDSYNTRIVVVLTLGSPKKQPIGDTYVHFETDFAWNFSITLRVYKQIF